MDSETIDPPDVNDPEFLAVRWGPEWRVHLIPEPDDLDERNGIADLVPGAACWPRFVGNRSERFEARTVQTRINDVDSPWLAANAASGARTKSAHRNLVLITFLLQ